MPSSAPLTLICLPFAGGTAAVYRDWPSRFPSWVRVAPLDLPGRGARHRSAALDDWGALRAWLSSEGVREQGLGDARGPVAIFGHSMGALVGFELAHALRAQGRPPVWLGVSACVAPPRVTLEEGWRDASAARVLDRLRSLGGTPAEVLASDDLLELALPRLRSDFHLCATYARSLPAGRPRLACPITIFAGAADPRTPTQEELDDWDDETSGGTCFERFAGGHFFLEAQRARVIDVVVRALADTFDGSRGASDARRAVTGPGAHGMEEQHR